MRSEGQTFVQEWPEHFNWLDKLMQAGYVVHYDKHELSQFQSKAEELLMHSGSYSFEATQLCIYAYTCT